MFSKVLLSFVITLGFAESAETPSFNTSWQSPFNSVTDLIRDILKIVADFMSALFGGSSGSEETVRMRCTEKLIEVPKDPTKYLWQLKLNCSNSNQGKTTAVCWSSYDCSWPEHKYTKLKATTFTINVTLNTGQMCLTCIRTDGQGSIVCNRYKLQRSSGNVNKDLRASKPYFVGTNIRKPNMTVLYQGSVDLNCEAEGNPFPNITWTEDIRSSLRVRQDLFMMFKPNFHNITEDRVYECQVANIVGSLKYSFYIKTTKIGYYNSSMPSNTPKLLTKNQNEMKIYQPVGSSLILTCDSTGNPYPNITWYQIEGPTETNLENLTNKFSFEIFKWFWTETDTFRCKVCNIKGCISSTHNIKYRQIGHHYRNMSKTKPVFLSPSNQTIEMDIGSTIELECLAKGNPTPNVTWSYKYSGDSGRWTNIPEIKNHFRTEFTLWSKSQTAYYRCNVCNELACILSIFNMTSKDVDAMDEKKPSAKPKFTKEVDIRVAISVGQTEDLECAAVGNPTPNITWFERPTNVFKHNYENTFFYRISYCDVDKNFTCLVKNELGEIERTFHVTEKNPDHFVDLSLFSAPRFLNLKAHRSKNVTVPIGGSAELNCQADGVPTPEISWWFQNKEKRTYFHPEAFHSFQPLQVTNKAAEGKYTCVVCNTAGRISFTFIVKQAKIGILDNTQTKVRPSFVETKDTTFCTGKVGSPFILDCLAHGNPPPNITWFHKRGNETGVILRDEFEIFDYRLSVTNWTDKYAGDFTCKLCNNEEQTCIAANGMQDDVCPPCIQRTFKLEINSKEDKHMFCN